MGCHGMHCSSVTNPLDQALVMTWVQLVGDRGIIHKIAFGQSDEIAPRTVGRGGTNAEHAGLDQAGVSRQAL